VILGIIRPYKRIRLDYLAAQLKITMDELMRLLIEIIQDGKSDLKIDQMRGHLTKPIDEYANIDVKRYNAFANMVRQLEGLRVSMVDKIV
jgi:COP9 signalosome complex subunit 2